LVSGIPLVWASMAAAVVLDLRVVDSTSVDLVSFPRSRMRELDHNRLNRIVR
jgi:hypothetical protein